MHKCGPECADTDKMAAVVTGAPTGANSTTSLFRRAVRALPAGVRLPAEEWDQRHRWIMRLLWLHVPVIVVYGLATGNSLLHSIGESLPTAAMGYLGSWPRLDRRTRAVLAGVGLMLASAVLVHMSGGVTEVHFHFFVMLGVISLYQDWQPFILSIAFVAAHHAVIGTISPGAVFDSEEAWRKPLLWAGVHAFFVLCASAVSIASWGIVEAGNRRARAALAASEGRFRALIEHSSDVVTVFDARGTIIYDSPSSTPVLGYPAGARVGQDGFSRSCTATTSTAPMTPSSRSARRVAASCMPRFACDITMAPTGGWRHRCPTSATSQGSTAWSPTSATSPIERPSRTSSPTRRSTIR